MSALSRRRKHKEELRRVILDAAREIFVRRGYESFSMRKLAEKIEYSPGSVYLHFKNKEQLFECLVDESFAHLLKTLLALRNGNEWQDPVAELKKGMRAYVEFGLRNPNDYRFAFMLRPPVENRPYKVHAAFEALRYIVGRCVEEKRFRAVDVETTIPRPLGNGPRDHFATDPEAEVSMGTEDEIDRADNQHRRRQSGRGRASDGGSRRASCKHQSMRIRTWTSCRARQTAPLSRCHARGYGSR